MTETVTCDECLFFERDTINPVAGVGYCRNHRQTIAAHSTHYPMAPHYCRLREPWPENDDVAV